MSIRPVFCKTTMLLILGTGLQALALGGAPLPGNAWEGAANGDAWQEGRENRPEHRDVRQERRSDKQERRADRPEPREVRQERRDQRPEPPPVRVAPRPVPRSQPYAQPRGVPQTRPDPRVARPDAPGSTGRSQASNYAPPSRGREQARAWESRRGWKAEGAWAAHSTWREHRANAWERDHRTWANRGGYGGYFIPEPQFRIHFGPDRWFRIRTRPMIHLGYPRFRYGNYWFLIVDPWPEFWTDNWYATDDVFIDYNNDGYYLYNRRHPGIAIAVSVSL